MALIASNSTAKNRMMISHAFLLRLGSLTLTAFMTRLLCIIFLATGDVIDLRLSPEIGAALIFTLERT
jgi:hypothetical protein